MSFANEFDAIRDKFEPYARKKILFAFNKQFEKINSIFAKNITNIELFNAVNTLDGKYIHDAFIDIYKTVGGKFALASIQNNRKSNEANLWETLIAEYIEANGTERIIGINETSKKLIQRSIRSSLVDAQAQGLGADETANLIRESVKDTWSTMAQYRALRIARTELLTASNAGSHYAMESLGYGATKEWSSFKDQRTRGMHPKDKHDHVNMNGQKVDLKGFFIEPLTGEKLMFPGDTIASAGNVVNCRCAVKYKLL